MKRIYRDVRQPVGGFVDRAHLGNRGQQPFGILPPRAVADLPKPENPCERRPKVRDRGKLDKPPGRPSKALHDRARSLSGEKYVVRSRHDQHCGGSARVDQSGRQVLTDAVFTGVDVVELAKCLVRLIVHGHPAFCRRASQMFTRYMTVSVRKRTSRDRLFDIANHHVPAKLNAAASVPPNVGNSSTSSIFWPFHAYMRECKSVRGADGSPSMKFTCTRYTWRPVRITQNSRPPG